MWVVCHVHTLLYANAPSDREVSRAEWFSEHAAHFACVQCKSDCKTQDLLHIMNTKLAVIIIMLISSAKLVEVVNDTLFYAKRS